MKAIKVTGYIDLEEMEASEPGSTDPDHEMGLSTQGYDSLAAEFSSMLDDVDFKLVER